MPKARSVSVYDRRWVRLKDEPLRLRQTILSVHKRRFWCRSCKKPFTEPLQGVRKGYRITERYRRRVLWACEHFIDLKSVRATYRCSSGLVHRVLYEQLSSSAARVCTRRPRRSASTNTFSSMIFGWSSVAS